MKRAVTESEMGLRQLPALSSCWSIYIWRCKYDFRGPYHLMLLAIGDARRRRIMEAVSPSMLTQADNITYRAHHGHHSELIW